jgi:hypothetical protein
MSEANAPPTETLEGTEGEDVKGTEDSDDVEAAINARLEAERERISQEVREALQQEFEERRKAEQDAYQNEANNQALLNSFGTTVREIRANLQGVKFYDEGGEERILSDDQLEQLVVRPLLRYNQTGERAASLRVLSTLSGAALSTLPDTVREEFIRKATGKPLQEWLDQYAELKAENTQWAKRQKTETEAAVKAAEARGAKKGQSAPAVAPHQGEGRPPSKAPDLSSISGLVAAKKAGLIDDNQFAEHWQKIRGT